MPDTGVVHDIEIASARTYAEILTPEVLAFIATLDRELEVSPPPRLVDPPAGA